MGDTWGGRRFFATACLLGALTALCAPAAFSQTLTRDDIAGVVKDDARGSVVPSAIVTLKYTVKTIGRSRVACCIRFDRKSGLALFAGPWRSSRHFN
jgi:hypothetical protein